MVLQPRLVQANVELVFFRANAGPERIVLEWETASELDNLGFNILRAESSNIAGAQVINDQLIPSFVGGQPTGAIYEWVDENVEEEMEYFYWLQDIDFNGGIENHGPVNAMLAGANTIATIPPATTIQPTAAPTNSPGLTQLPSPTPVPTNPPTSQATDQRQFAPSDTAEATAAISALINESVPLNQPVQPTAPVSASTPAIDQAPPVVSTGETHQTASILSEDDSGEQLSIAAFDQTPGSIEQGAEAVQSIADPSHSIEGSASGSSTGRASSDNQKLAASKELESRTGKPVSKTTSLAITALVAAVFLAVVALITGWLVLSSQDAKIDNE